MSFASANPRRASLSERRDAVREQVEIAAVVGRVVKLGRGNNPRGKCPFHGSKSDSFTVYPDTGRAKCWGCGWSGDAIEFVRDSFGLGFIDALERLEGEHGLDGLAAAPVQRARQPVRRRERETVDSVVFGRLMWKRSRADLDAVRTYLRGRGVPDVMLSAERLADIRFVGLGPIAAWPEGGDPDSMPQAPAMVALMRRPIEWRAGGVHVTFLAPSLASKMVRKRQNGTNYPDRKMLGPAGGACVLLPGRGGFAPNSPLFVGEGIETVLSGMALASAPPEACGMAVLSLNNLQGVPRLIKGALPLYDPQPDPEANQQPVAFAHAGPVTGLIDADMAPLRGPIDRATGEPRGMALIEERRGPIVHRTLSSAERSELCAALFVAAWRGQGCRAEAVRPRMGLDFNDAVRVG